MLTGSFLILFIFFVIYGYRWLMRYRHHTTGWRGRIVSEDTVSFPRHPPKPEWVRREIIRLKALMPQDGCRTIAHTFNRRYALKRRMTVGKTFVSYTTRNHQYEIQVLRRNLKHQRPKPVPKHLIWGMDLTYLSDADSQPHPILGLVEHHSRGCLTLEVLHTKTSVALLRRLLNAIEALGNIKPIILRTDNEAVFTSWLFRLGLFLLRIKHQRIDYCCPWQNGRVERFFGTLKAKTKDLVFLSIDALQRELNVFRFWYNQIRPHQYLDGLTPAEAYRGSERIGRYSRKAPIWFETWDGALTGFYFPP